MASLVLIATLKASKCSKPCFNKHVDSNISVYFFNRFMLFIKKTGWKSYDAKHNPARSHVKKFLFKLPMVQSL